MKRVLSWLGLREPFHAIGATDFYVRFKGHARPAITVGAGSYANQLTIYCWKPGLEVSFGNYCSIAENVNLLLGGEHDAHWVSTFPFYEYWQLPDQEKRMTRKTRGPIEIGHDVWIGHGATILSGTKIGTGAIIGAGSVLRGDVPAYAIMAGNPAKLIRYRFAEDIRAQLLASQWWDLPRQALVNLSVHFHDPVEFIGQLSRYKKSQSLQDGS